MLPYPLGRVREHSRTCLSWTAAPTGLYSEAVGYGADLSRERDGPHSCTYSLHVHGSLNCTSGHHVTLHTSALLPTQKPPPSAYSHTSALAPFLHGRIRCSTPSSAAASLHWICHWDPVRDLPGRPTGRRNGEHHKSRASWIAGGIRSPPVVATLSASTAAANDDDRDRSDRIDPI